MKTDAETLNVDVSFVRGALTVTAALTVGERPVALIGPNGAGKTSLLLAILGIVVPQRGRVTVGDAVLFDAASAVDVPVEERRLAYVPQNYALFPHLTAAQNVAFALGCRTPAVPRAERRRRAAALLENVGAASFADRLPQQLSGGEKQRVALARALATSPRALLFDEPVAALDVERRDEFRVFLTEHLRRTALPTIIVTHDVADARALDADVVVMEQGRIAASDSLAAITLAPPTAYAARFTAPLARLP